MQTSAPKVRVWDHGAPSAQDVHISKRLTKVPWLSIRGEAQDLGVQLDAFTSWCDKFWSPTSCLKETQLWTGFESTIIEKWGSKGIGCAVPHLQMCSSLKFLVCRVHFYHQCWPRLSPLRSLLFADEIVRDGAHRSCLSQGVWGAVPRINLNLVGLILLECYLLRNQQRVPASESFGEFSRENVAIAWALQRLLSKRGDESQSIPIDNLPILRPAENGKSLKIPRAWHEAGSTQFLGKPWRPNSDHRGYVCGSQDLCARRPLAAHKN